jgi:hypothetical protein
MNVRRQTYVYLARPTAGNDKRFLLGRVTAIARDGQPPEITLPEDQELVHAIPTMDPDGLESYWRKRFGIRRGKNDWFRPNGRDVNAFKSAGG